MTLPEPRPICPRCRKSVAKVEEHELHMQLANAAEGAPEEHTNLHAIFHHRCAGRVWNATRTVWFGEDDE